VKRKDRIKALFKLVPGVEMSGLEALEITGFWLSYDLLAELENEGFLASRWIDPRPGLKHRRRLYRLSQAASVGEVS
jgi:hypothetical protein